MRKEKWENLFQFFGGYFHQDFAVEFETPEAAVRKFITDTDRETSESVLRELKEVLTETSDRELEDVVFELGCYYSPQRHRGIAMRVWLGQVVDQVRVESRG